MMRSGLPGAWPADVADLPPKPSVRPPATRLTLLSWLGQAVFVSVVVLNGTYFRSREAVAVPKADWYVLLRLFASVAACGVAVLLIPKNRRWGWSGKCLLFYVLAVWISLIHTPYRTTVVGYAILLSGAAALPLALVYHARNVADLERLQRLWGLTVSALVIKDTMTALFFVHMPSNMTGGRLGMGVTHATELSLLAAILFWLSCETPGRRNRVIKWGWRIFLLFVIVEAKSRVSVVSFVVGGFCHFFFGTRDYVKRWIIVSGGAFLLVSVFLALSLGQDWACGLTNYMKRGQDAKELTSVTGRTFIWKHIASRIHESPLVGNGFGVSRLVMGPVPGMTNWEPPHCHNEFLEVLFSTGIVGFIPFLGMILLSLRWVTDSGGLQRVLSPVLGRHAVGVISMLVVSLMFEVRLSGRLSSFQPLFFLYLTMLDRADDFRTMPQLQAGRSIA